ncbi:restriction endonuclease subunit S [Arthrobacter sp. CAN_C5]|uniref:restriction endonuclease subunit S n=1 Tax=Arthrobacter sp. CAN_C5 TaxID=2760706 RepID=UPI001AE74DBE|nr:restriction endonuclease subunit S [Arthrobacter sp. CAN_C5]MBP2216060.1 type I restriction enzyme S subunit [Arthrobacter sp. CAN_C5]
MTKQSVPLRRVARIINGGTPTPDPENWNGKIPWATPVDLGRTNGFSLSETGRNLTILGALSGSAIAPKSSVLLSTRAPIGYVAINEVPMAFNQGCKALIPADGVSARFLKYALIHTEPQLQSMGQGSTFLELSASALASVEIPLPTTDVQVRTVDFLDKETAQIDGLIGKQERLIELLIEKRQAIITHTVTRGLDPTAPTKPSRTPWLNAAPEHWTKIKLSWAFRFLNGDRGSNYPSRDEFQPEGVAFINAGHLSGGRVDLSTMNYISREKYEELGGAKLRVGDVLYCLRGSLGKHALLTGLQEGALASSLVALRALHNARVSPAYLALLFKSPAAETQLAIIASGSAQPNMSVENLQSFSFPIPPLEEQQRILDYVNRKCDRLNTIQGTARKMVLRLQERRSALISAAVTGKINVQEGIA